MGFSVGERGPVVFAFLFGKSWYSWRWPVASREVCNLLMARVVIMPDLTGIVEYCTTATTHKEQAI